MRPITILLTALIATGCAVDRRCGQVCAALHAVRPDAEGYLPRDAVFKAVGISDADSIPFISTLYGGYKNLDCGCMVDFSARGLPKVPTEKTIDRILNNPNRNGNGMIPNQFESVVLVDKKSREICRIESRSKRRERVVGENKEAEQIMDVNRTSASQPTHQSPRKSAVTSH